ncbi:MAG: ProQ/FINO family protein [Variovorax sp.]
MTTETAPAPNASRAPKNRKPRPEGKAAETGAPKRARKPHPTLELLFGLYPDLFGARFLPLQRGVFQALLEKHPDVFQRDELKVALGLHTRSTKYLERVAAGDKRHGLDGQPVEAVAPEHVHHAILEVHKRRQTRTADDLRPQLRKQLVAAFERSGLSREDYLMLVRGNDEATNALVDEAFADLAAQTAKREALQRAFHASGKSVAEFAEMYGLDPREVGRTLSV